MYMLFTDPDRRFAEGVAAVAYTNPFLPARIAAEERALGPDFTDDGAVWVAEWGDVDPSSVAVERPNVALLRDRSWEAARRARARISAGGAGGSEADLHLFEDLALYALFARYERQLYLIVVDEAEARPKLAFYRHFEADFRELLQVDGVRLPSGYRSDHVLSLFFQIRRAFHHIFRAIYGTSFAAARLRAHVWQSVFTHDLARYQRGVYRRMHDIPTLVTGPSGTGKDLVAQAVGKSRYLPLDANAARFSAPSRFHPLSLSALSPTLVESELFGHRRGSFTGAVEDREGHLEGSGPFGTVFLDEIGDLDAGIQVKLLRVLQDRVFHRIGDSAPRTFEGKVVAATNKDLEEEMRAGRFREDLYYRLCADRVETPSLRTRLDDDPRELETLVELLSRRIAGEEAARGLAREVLEWIAHELPPDYAWPGNVRELEQCIRNVLVRREYRTPARPRSDLDALDWALLGSGLGAEELVRRYSALVYARTGSYVETGRRLGLDRRTVKEHVTRAGSGGTRS